MRFFIGIAAVAALFILSVPNLYAETPPAGAVSEEEAATAWADAARDLNLQTQIPKDSSQPLPELEFEPISLPPALVGLARFLLWGGLAALAVIFILKLTDGLRNRQRGLGLEAEGEEGGAEASGLVAARLDQAHLEAEELARSGQFAKAMHILLLQSLMEMRRRLDISLAISLTSREIVARVALGAATRAALADLVGRVEISYFGEYAAGEAEYLASRQSFEVFSQNLKAGGQA
jgi:hypothetical protein